MSEETKNNIISNNLENVMHISMIPYAEYVILDRALPRVEDGMKPGQRRILYSMWEQGFTPDKGYKKSAKVVGDVLAKYHPHGDTSVYDAMVRMAQQFNMRMPLIDGHGNFGSIDGDGAAAMRYTEVRLQPLALELLRDLDKETVKYSLNFDDSLKEPDTLPSRYPNLLVNGASGIAVGLATSIPPHNLGEVIDGVIQYINNPKIKLEEMLKYVKGPDFPTGGFVIAGKDMENAYRTGKGRVVMRSRVIIEKGEYDKQNIVITEMPYQVNKAALLSKIADLKDIKKDELAGIDEIVDESDRHGMRAVIKVKKDGDPQQILKFLYKNTQLETAFNYNMVAIANGKPQQMGLLDIISYYVEYQREVILRRTRYDLNKAKERAHILEGLVIAIQNIDEVIKIIKNAPTTVEAKQSLRNRFSLSDVQAQAILDLRLARLSKLEVYKLEEELRDLRALIIKLQEIVDSKKMQMNVVKEEITALKKKFKDPRRSEIVGEVSEVNVPSFDDVKPVENFVFCYTQAGMIKKVPKKNFDLSDRTVTATSSPNDIIKLKADAATDSTLYIFTDKGNCFKIDPEIPQECKFRDKGMAFDSLNKDILKTEKPVAFFVFKDALPETDLLFFTKSGMVKRTAWKEYDLQKNSFQAAKIKDDDEIIAVETDLPETTVVFVTNDGLCLNCVKDDIPRQGRVSGGVKGIVLADDDFVRYVGQVGVEPEGELIVVTSFGTFKRVIIAGALEPMQRARKGVKIADLGYGAECVVYSGFVTTAFDLAVKERLGDMFIVNTEDIPLDTRTSKGKQLPSRKNSQPDSCYKIGQ